MNLKKEPILKFSSTLYLHGSLPLAHEGAFLGDLTNELMSPSLIDLNSSNKDVVEHITKSIEKLKTPLLCGYSMGGRILLEVLKRIQYQPTAIALMGCALPLEDQTVRQERIKQDMIHAKLMQTNLSSFLNSWYDSPLWAMNKMDKDQLIKNYLKEYKDQQKRKALSELFTDFSPGVFPRNKVDPSHFREKFPDTSVLYFSGELDSKYCKEAKNFGSFFKKFEPIMLENVGHKLHQFQREQNIIKDKLLKLCH